MVLTNAQITAFFTDAGQMNLPPRTRVFLQSEGITSPEDLAEFTTKEAWEQVLENCKRPPQIPDPANATLMINDQPYRMPAKSLMRLKVAAVAIKFYQDTSRPLAAGMLTWSTRLVSFQQQWAAILDLKKSDGQELPKITKSVPIAKWIEAYETFSEQAIGVRNAPLKYVIRDDVAVPVAAPALEAGSPHSTEHGSVKGEMTARLSHTHPLFRDDNGAVYDDIETATRGTKYAASIITYKRTKNGRGALGALKTAFAGKAMYDADKKVHQDFLLNRKWTGTNNFTLERFLNQHRSAYSGLERCAENVATQLPDERTRVQYIMDNIQCNDPGVKAAIESIRVDDTANGLRNNFEAAVVHLQPCCPVSKRQRSSNKRGLAEIAATSGSLKSGSGGTGVEYRYYTTKEYNKLSKDQKDELREYRKEKESKGGNPDKSNGGFKKKNFKATVASVVNEMRKKEEKKNDQLTEMRSIISSLIVPAEKTNADSETADGKTVKFAQSSEESAEIAAVKLQKLLTGRKGKKARWA